MLVCIFAVVIASLLLVGTINSVFFLSFATGLIVLLDLHVVLLILLLYEILCVMNSTCIRYGGTRPKYIQVQVWPCG
jgi:hypothetical protein